MKEDYYKLLLDPIWQEKRLNILKRDNFSCLICSDKESQLQIHHERYVKLPWDIDDKYLKTLCYRCHEVVELCKKNSIKYINFNRIPYQQEKFIYLVNSIFYRNNKGEYVYVIHNFNSSSFVLVSFPFSRELVDLMLKTF